MYNVQILSDAEFESLPYPETETSWGIADPKSNTAYVRYDKSPEAMNYLINHELDHLIDGHGGVHSDHYRNGVYYKGFGDIFQSIIAPLASFIPGIGQILGPSLGMAGSLLNKPKTQTAQSGSSFSGMSGGQPSTQFMPTQTGSSAPSPSTGFGQGASGSTGALGQQPTGTPVDRMRPDFGISSEEAFRRSKGSGLGGF